MRIAAAPTARPGAKRLEIRGRRIYHGVQMAAPSAAIHSSLRMLLLEALHELRPYLDQAELDELLAWWVAQAVEYPARRLPSDAFLP